MMRSKNKGQASLEYAVLITLIIGALLSMQHYMKRGVQGRLKESVDGMGDQYDPEVTISDTRHSFSSETITQINAVSAAGGYWTMRTDYTTSTAIKRGNTVVGAY